MTRTVYKVKFTCVNTMLKLTWFQMIIKTFNFNTLVYVLSHAFFGHFNQHCDLSVVHVDIYSAYVFFFFFLLLWCRATSWTDISCGLQRMLHCRRSTLNAHICLPHFIHFQSTVFLWAIQTAILSIQQNTFVHFSCLSVPWWFFFVFFFNYKRNLIFWNFHFFYHICKAWYLFQVSLKKILQWLCML